jgi:transcriptional regulator with GAF, ATPase, and Fis domain
VLITGETGIGKELIARAIHKGSQRADQAFITVNCAAIPPSLLASELFGHEKGAFTGAMQRRQGRFELADSGTLFLDEIGELPAETQIALLRVIQERQFERVGGSQVIPIDVRIIAATNSDLPAAISAGTFRADLFYRLNVFPIDVPPLRQRKEDIPMLVEYFVKRYADKGKKKFSKIENKTFKLCQSYDWPGSIRELQNIIERSVILSTGETFRIDPGLAFKSEQTSPGIIRAAQTKPSELRTGTHRGSARGKQRKSCWAKWRGCQTRNSAIDPGSENQTTQHKETCPPVVRSCKKYRPARHSIPRIPCLQRPREYSPDDRDTSSRTGC